MKKIVLTCMMAILSLSFANAKQNYDEEDEEEDEKEQTIYLGFTAGYNRSTYFLSDRTPKWGHGGQIGINCEVFAGRYFSIQPELIFSYKTIGVDNFVIPTNIDYNVEKLDNVTINMINSTDRLWYASIPVNLKISYPFISGRPFFSIAPVLDLGLYGKNKVNDYNELKSLLLSMGLFDAKKDDIKDYDLSLFQANPNDKAFDYRTKPIYRNFNFAVLFKAGIDFSSGLSLSAAYQIGLTNMYKLTPQVERFYNMLGMKLNQNIHTFSASVGFRF